MLVWWTVVTAKTPQELDLVVNDKSAILATWEAGIGGTAWIEELVKSGKAHVYRLRGGYPNRYSAFACDVLPLIADAPPSHTAPEMLAWNDEANQSVLIPANYQGNITLHRDRIAACGPRPNFDDRHLGPNRETWVRAFAPGLYRRHPRLSSSAGAVSW